MHRLHSKSTVNRFRLAAILLLVQCVLTPVAVLILIGAVTMRDRELTHIGIAVMAFTLLILLIRWVISARTNCPICLTPVLAKKHCAKHNKAKTLLGSYRLKAAMGMLLFQHFRCPYCNEPTAMEARDRTSPHSYSRG